MKYLIYTRVSEKGSDFDNENSIEMQKQFCRDYAKFHGHTVLKEVADEYMSGKDMNRPGLQQILRELEYGQADWDVLIVYKLSRLTRSLKDGAALFDTLFRAGKGFISATENIDFSSPAGRAMLGMLHVFNQFEREQTGQNTKNRMIQIAREGGIPWGLAPLGYIRGEKHDNVLKVDPRNAEIVKDIFEMYVRGVPPVEILIKYKPILKHRTKLYWILKNKIYNCLIEYDGKVYPGKHERIIPVDLWERAQGRLPDKVRRTRPAAQKHPYLLTGLIKCACGRFLVPESAKGGRHHYYRCVDNITCKTRIRADAVETAVLDKVKALDINPEIIEKAVQKINQFRLKLAHMHRPELTNTQKALRDVYAEREKIEKVILSGLLTRANAASFNSKLEALAKEAERLDKAVWQMKQVCEPDPKSFESAEDIIRQVKTFNSALSANPEDFYRRRQAILMNVKKVQKVKDKNWTLELNYSGKVRLTDQSGCPNMTWANLAFEFKVA
jgi:site-specific DNA recombinase